MSTHCSYCHREYPSDPPGQWETLAHLHDCIPLPSRDKAGLFHEAMMVATRLQAKNAQFREALVRCDSMLSLLRYRCEHTIPWGEIGIPTREHVDEVIGQARQAQRE